MDQPYSHPIGPDGWPTQSGGPCVCLCTCVVLAGVLYGPGTRAEVDDVVAMLPPGTDAWWGLHGWRLSRGTHTGVGTLDDLRVLAQGLRSAQPLTSAEADSHAGLAADDPYMPYAWQGDPLA